MIAVAVTDTMNVTANIITATTPVDNPVLSDFAACHLQNTVKYSYILIM